VLPPAFVPSPDSLVLVVSNEGKMLAFKVSDVPEMPKGKGNKLFDIPSKKAASREEVLTGVAVVPPNGTLVLWSGEKQKTFSWADLKEFKGQRAQRGAVLPRGWRDIDRVEGFSPPPKAT
jgi:topoisomerase-4 subunit A